MIGRAVDDDVKPDRPEGSLRGFGQQRQLLTAGIREPANGQLLPILFPDAVAIHVHPACLFQNSARAVRIIFLGRDRIAPERKNIRKGAGGRISVPVQQIGHEALFVDPIAIARRTAGS